MSAVVRHAIKTEPKMAGCPIFHQEKQGQSRSYPARIGQRRAEDVQWKNPEKPQFFGVLKHR
jgi:hypothetical protein